ncbi:hypothetical protein P154DRAFT_538587 [Amniculicola lignicola CBS 123094]|uniref:Centromere protein X n=1 Tax=Amniculicola lignicola CBS 123094 TaxID=1392246 RepID=A0A6A5W1D0_9PLEO|nr:hypothetical protein P154DRAFT_538587 [Amniculicola lignicola CBS 123094]
MPPKATNASQRKGPAFKPPRPIRSNSQTTNTTTKRVPAKNAAPPPRNSINIPTLISSSDDDVGADDDPSASEGDEEMEDAPDVSNLQPPKELVPKKLLSRLLYEGFEDQSMKINQGAFDLFAMYIDTFVREAIARAHYDKEKTGDDDGFLQVEDLEKLAPKLVLDF